MDFFIYTFMAMMGLIIIQLLSEFFIDLYRKRKERKAKTEAVKKDISTSIRKSLKYHERSNRELIKPASINFESLTRDS